MTPEIWAEIRRLFKIEQLSVSEIARRVLLDRKTVRAALRSESGPPVRQSLATRPSQLDPYKPFIQKRLQEFSRISAVRLLRELKPLGYPGAITVLKDYLSTLRPRIQEAFFRIETQPGEQAQVDWAHCGALRFGNTWRKLSVFVMVLSYSRMMYAEFSLSQCLEDFLAAHWRAFQFFGGIPKKCLYDNLKSVVLTRYGTDIRFNPKFMEFAGVCLFEPVLCRPRHGNEKGKVENGIKYFQGSFLDGRDRTIPWPLWSSDLGTWLSQVANLRLHGTTRVRPIDRFELERPLLQALPAHAPDTSIVRSVQVASQCLVKFDGNRYSVPFQWVGKVLTLKATRTEVQIFADTRRLALHARSFERGLVIENPAHYQGLLATKKAARAAKITDQFLALAHPSQEAKTTLEAYLQGLIHADLHIFHHLQKILEMTALYGRTEILQAITQALQFKAFGSAYLENIVTQQRALRGLKESTPIIIPTKPDWTRETVEEQDLGLYDDLFKDSDNASKEHP
jgi:transposase